MLRSEMKTALATLVTGSILAGCVEAKFAMETLPVPAAFDVAPSISTPPPVAVQRLALPATEVFAHPEPAGARVWRDEWNLAVAHAIDTHSPELLDNAQLPNGEIAALCPGFATATEPEKEAFWALFLASISRFESTFDPEAKLVEDWNDPETGAPQLSAGLLQLSYSDRLNHPDCPLAPKRHNLTDPTAQLSCGVAILRKQIEVRGTLFPHPKPYYWAVLSGKRTRLKVRNYFRRNLAQLPFCQEPTNRAWAEAASGHHFGAVLAAGPE